MPEQHGLFGFDSEGSGWDSRDCEFPSVLLRLWEEQHVAGQRRWLRVLQMELDLNDFLPYHELPSWSHLSINVTKSQYKGLTPIAFDLVDLVVVESIKMSDLMPESVFDVLIEAAVVMRYREQRVLEQRDLVWQNKVIPRPALR